MKMVQNVYLILLVTSVFFTLLLFWTKNSPQLVTLNDTQQLSNFNLELCSFSDRRVRIKGWAFIENQQYFKHEVFLQREDKQWISLYTRMQKRPDVSKAFDEDDLYDNSGFIAATRKDPNLNYTGNVRISVISNEGVVQSATIKCAP